MPTQRTLPAFRVVLVALLLMLGWGAAAHAGSVQFDLSARETSVGIPVQLRVEVRDAASHDPPAAPIVEGATVEALPPARSSFTSIVNGRRSDRSTTTYTFLITPQREGELIVPPVTCMVDGSLRASPEHRIAVRPMRQGDEFVVEVLATPAQTWAGAAVDLRLRIWILPFVDQRYSVRLQEGHMWSLLDEGSQWGVFEPAVREYQRLQRMPPARQRDRVGSDGETREYYVYELSRTIWPSRPGPLELGTILLRLRYPLRLERSDDIFNAGRLVIADSRMLVAQPQPPEVLVRALPTAGRPEGFRGAVGRFEMSAYAAPLEVAVGEPVTLTLTIADRSSPGIDLDTLVAPPLAEQVDLVRDFRVSDDALAGETRGRTKTFSATIRPLRDGVTRIPPIVLDFFDPESGTWARAATDPIPIRVRPGTGLDESAIVDARGAGAAGDGAATPEPLLPNVVDAGALLETSRGMAPGLALALLLAPPLAAAAVATWRLARWRAGRDPVGTRRRLATRQAQRRLAAARTPEAVRGAMVDWLADLADRPAGAMTAEEATACARSLLGAAESEALRDLLHRCELASFAGAGGDGADLARAAGAIVARARIAAPRAAEALAQDPAAGPRGQPA